MREPVRFHTEHLHTHVGRNLKVEDVHASGARWPFPDRNGSVSTVCRPSALCISLVKHKWFMQRTETVFGFVGLVGPFASTTRTTPHQFYTPDAVVQMSGGTLF